MNEQENQYCEQPDPLAQPVCENPPDPSAPQTTSGENEVPVDPAHAAEMEARQQCFEKGYEPPPTSQMPVEQGPEAAPEPAPEPAPAPKPTTPWPPPGWVPYDDETGCGWKPPTDGQTVQPLTPYQLEKLKEQEEKRKHAEEALKELADPSYVRERQLGDEKAENYRPRPVRPPPRVRR